MIKKRTNRQWERVSGAPLSDYSRAAERNKNTFKSGVFTAACEKAGITPTTRQASKFSRGMGAAYKSRKM